MLFSSDLFLFLFLPVVLLVYYGPLRASRRGQNLFLLAASLFFYGWKEPVFVLVMLGSVVYNYALGLWVWRRKTAGKGYKGPVFLAVAGNLGLLFGFKYLTFFMANLRSLWAELPYWDIALPVGISFFTFQALSYVLDVARGEAEVQKNPLNVGLYIAFFPQLIAGPIVKYSTVAHQIEYRQESWESFSQGCWRFLIGLGKKVILANQLAVVADAAFNGGGPESVSMAWLGSLCYTLQIYFDFGGYSDMAIGLGKMFGFQFLENFRYPYLARSCRDFWKRWHISLTTWFRDYLYIPLGGNRGGEAKTWRNMFVVWLFTGVWHGANWTFIVWGLTWFCLLAVERLWEPLKGYPLWFQRLCTLVVVNFTWVLFRADTLADALHFLGVMFQLDTVQLWSLETGYYLRQNAFTLAVAALACGPTATWLRGRMARLSESRGREWVMPLWDGVCALSLAAVFLVCAAFLAKESHNPFIYFNF